MLTTIYGLVDSAQPDAIRYVGKTKGAPEKRLTGHLRQASRGCPVYRSRWIRSVVSAGGRVECIVIARAATEEEGNELERFHIARLRADGARLTNLTIGGDGLVGPSDETLKRMRTARARQVTSKETRAKMSAALHRRYESAEARQRTADTSRGRTLTLEAREKIAAWHRGRTHGSQSEEHRRKIAAALRGRKKSAAHVKKVADALRGRPRSPDTIAKMSAATRRQWANRSDRRQSPEHRRHIKEGLAQHWARRREAALASSRKVVD